MATTVNDINTIKQLIVANFPIKSLQECSYDDDHKISLINGNYIDVYNFDDICKDIFKTLHSDCRQPKSLDALYLNIEDTLVFIEFKNSRWKDISKDDVILKIYDSLSLIAKYYDVTFEKLKTTKIYLIIKRDTKMNSFARKATNGTCPPNFRFIKETLGIDIARYDAIDFEEYLKKHNKLPAS
ncbi:hypothetical protein ACLJKH_001448 [Bacillus cereus]